jgi:hypothetical protein
MQVVQETGIGIPLTEVLHDEILAFVSERTWADEELECAPVFDSSAGGDRSLTTNEVSCFLGCVDRVQSPLRFFSSIDRQIQSFPSAHHVNGYCLESCIDEPSAVIGIRRACPDRSGILVGHDGEVLGHGAGSLRRFETFTFARLPVALTEKLSSILRGTILGFSANLEVASPLSRDQLSCSGGQSVGDDPSGIQVDFVCTPTGDRIQVEGLGGYIRAVSICPVVDVGAIRNIDRVLRRPFITDRLDDPSSATPGSCEWWRDHRDLVVTEYVQAGFPFVVESTQLQVEVDAVDLRLFLRNLWDDVAEVQFDMHVAWNLQLGLTDIGVQPCRFGLDLRPTAEIGIENFQMDRSSFRLTATHWFTAEELEPHVHDAMMVRLEPDVIVIATDGEFCPSLPGPFLGPVQIVRHDMALFVPGCPHGDAADPAAPAPEGCDAGWSNAREPDGGNLVRAMVRPLNGATRIGNRWIDIVPEMQIRAMSQEEDGAISDWQIRPTGVWSEVEGEVPYFKGVQPAEWPLSSLSNYRRLWLAARPTLHARRSTAPLEAGRACVLGLGQLIDVLEGGFPPSRSPDGPNRPGVPGDPCSPKAACDFVGRPIFGPHHIFDDTQTLAAELDDSPVLVTWVDDKSWDDGGRVIIRPIDPDRGVDLDLGERIADRLRGLCETQVSTQTHFDGHDGLPGPIDHFPPQVLVEYWEEGYQPETVAELEDDPRLRLEHGMLTTGLGSRSEETTLVALVLPTSEERITGHQRLELGFIRFDAQGRVASRLDESWTDDTAFGVRTPDGRILGPTLIPRLSREGLWLRHPGSTPWPRAQARNALLGTADMPSGRVTLPIVGRGGRTEAYLGNHWTLDRAGGRAYASYDPVGLYRYRIGLTSDMAELLDRGHGAFDLTVDAPARGSACFPADIRRRTETPHGKIDRVDLLIRETQARGGHQRYRIDAGDLFLGRTGPVPLPYLTPGGELEPGESTARGTVADVISSGERFE